MKTIYLAGGCFWGTQMYFDGIRGVTGTTVGYANGKTAHPTYEQVKHENTGHAETVKVDFDETAVGVAELIEAYFEVIDPLSVDRQGGDVGRQYRTGIYYDDETLLPEIEKAYSREETRIGAKLAVELRPLVNFYPAEEYHQNYLVKHPDGYCHIPREKMKRGK